jgi:hypothetical protein
MISLQLKGKWSIRQMQGFHSNSVGIIYPLPYSKTSYWYTLSLISFLPKGGNLKASQGSSFLAINA